MVNNNITSGNTQRARSPELSFVTCPNNDDKNTAMAVHTMEFIKAGKFPTVLSLDSTSNQFISRMIVAALSDETFQNMIKSNISSSTGEKNPWADYDWDQFSSTPVSDFEDHYGEKLMALEEDHSDDDNWEQLGSIREDADTWSQSTEPTEEPRMNWKSINGILEGIVDPSLTPEDVALIHVMDDWVRKLDWCLSREDSADSDYLYNLMDFAEDRNYENFVEEVDRFTENLRNHIIDGNRIDVNTVEVPHEKPMALILDTVTLFTDDYDNEKERVSAISDILKAISVKYNAHVVAFQVTS